MRLSPRKHPDRLLRRLGAVCGAASALIFANVAFAADSTSVQRYELFGSGLLTLDQPVQKNGNLRLKAYMTSQDTQLAAAAPAQAGGGFALTASMTATQLVCYNDTIFRDDFDGDGG